MEACGREATARYSQWQDLDNGACAYLDRAERDLDARREKKMLGCGEREIEWMLEGRMGE